MHFSLAVNYLCQGKYDLALAETDKVFFLIPDIPYSFWLKALIYHCNGDLIKSEEEFRKLMKTEVRVAEAWANEGLGALYLLQGKFDKSEEHIKQAIEVDRNLGEVELKSRHNSYLAYMHSRSGNHETALEECDKALNSGIEAEKSILQILALHSKGLTYLYMKSMDEAQKTADELKEWIDKGLNKKALRHYYHLMGRIELERRDFPKAIEYFKQALALLPFQSDSDFYFFNLGSAFFIDSTALAYFRAGELEESRKEYERITSLTTGRVFFGDIYAKSFYMSGKIYEQQGDKTKAIEHYEKFLDLWKDADPGIAEVEDARERLAGLKE